MELDYKKLYEEAKEKLDKIAYNELKGKVSKELGLEHRFNPIYYNYEDNISCIKNNQSLEFMHYNDSIKCQKYIDEIGFDKLWAIIKEVYNDDIAKVYNDTAKEEETE